MRSRFQSRTAAFAVLILSALTGCQSDQTNHEKNVQAANKRWSEVRASSILQMAQQQFDAGDLEQAEKTILEALSIDPELPILHVLSGRIALERGQLERSYHRFDRAIELDDKNPDPYYFQGIVLQRWERYDTALERYTKANELQPDSVAHLLARAEMLVALDRTDDATTLLLDKFGYFDQNAGIRTALGNLAIMKGDFKQAASYFQQASLLLPDDLQILQDLALAQLASDQIPEAVRNLEYLTQQPDLIDRSDLKRSLASAYLAAGRHGDAKQTCLKLTRNDPSDLESWIKLGEIAWVTDDTSGVLMASQRIKLLARDRHEGYLFAGLVLQKRGQIQESIVEFQQAAELAPNDSEALILQGVSFEQSGQPDRAVQAYSEALRRQPGDAYAKRLLDHLSAAAKP
jgi:tetratricopeptide (TPR) repeat protein